LVLRKHHRRTAADRGACKMTNRPMLLTPAGHNSMMRWFARAFGGAADMPARKRIEDQIFEPDLIEAICSAFQRACVALQLQGTSDAFTEIVATKIIELAKAGEFDPERLCSKVLSELSEQRKAS
jgi:hypothetical protein